MKEVKFRINDSYDMGAVAAFINSLEDGTSVEIIFEEAGADEFEAFLMEMMNREEMAGGKDGRRKDIDGVGTACRGCAAGSRQRAVFRAEDQ